MLDERIVDLLEEVGGWGNSATCSHGIQLQSRTRLVALRDGQEDRGRLFGGFSYVSRGVQPLPGTSFIALFAGCEACGPA